MAELVQALSAAADARFEEPVLAAAAAAEPLAMRLPRTFIFNPAEAELELNSLGAFCARCESRRRRRRENMKRQPKIATSGKIAKTEAKSANSRRNINSDES